MKTSSTLAILIIFISFHSASAQTSWTQLSDVGIPPVSPPIAHRGAAVTFYLLGKVYWGTGQGVGIYHDDWWQIDPVTKAFTQMASLPASPRSDAIAFTLGTKGYVGLGDKGAGSFKDLYEYDPPLNVWTKKADLPGAGRHSAVAFTINGAGYVGTGQSLSGQLKEFWRYNQSSNSWTKRADFGGTERSAAFGFALNGKGYIGTGLSWNTLGFYAKDVWEYDPNVNTWTQKSDFGGGLRMNTTGFAIGNNGYSVAGDSVSNGGGYAIHDLWQYDQPTDSWTKKSNYPGISTDFPSVAVWNDTALVSGEGQLFEINCNEFYTYKAADDHWDLFVKTAGTAYRSNAVGFGVAGKGYIGTGAVSSASHPLNELFEFDPTTGSWQQKNNIPVTGLWGAVAFTINDVGYVGTGNKATNTLYSKEVWKYDPPSGVWTQEADFGGEARAFATGFSTDTKGYIGSGIAQSGSVKSDFWSYDPITNSWTQITDYPGGNRKYAVAFAIDNKGYVGTGATSGNVVVKDFYCYNPLNNSWNHIADYGGDGRKESVSFTINGKGYVGLGMVTNNNIRGDFYSYDPIINEWKQEPNFGGGARYGAVGFSLNDKGYVGTGLDSAGGYKADFWEFTPCAISSVSISASGPTTFCNGSNVKLTASGTLLNYQWKKDGISIIGATKKNYTAKQTGIYRCDVTYTCGVASSNTVSITALPLPVAKIKNVSPINICQGQTKTLHGKAGFAYLYQWQLNGINIPGANSDSFDASEAGNYTLVITSNVNGCSKTSQPVVINITCKESEPDIRPLTVYPNPARDNVYVSFPGDDGPIQIEVINILGIKVIEQKAEMFATDISVDVHFLPEGAYLIKIIEDNEIRTAFFEIRR